MKSSFVLFFSMLMISTSVFAQEIPADSLYLGQMTPGSIPKIFPLLVSAGSFAAERIAISKDETEIFYSEIKSYYPVTGAKIRYYKYENKKWSESKVLFEGFLDQLYHSAKIPCLLSMSLICIIQLEKKTCGVHQNYFVVQSNLLTIYK